MNITITQHDDGTVEMTGPLTGMLGALEEQAPEASQLLCGAALGAFALGAKSVSVDLSKEDELDKQNARVVVGPELLEVHFVDEE